MAAGNSELGSAFITIYPQVDRNFRTTVGKEFSKGLDPKEFGGAGGMAGEKFGSGFKAAAAAALETLGDVLMDFVHWAMNILGSLTREAMSNEDALIKFSKSMTFAGFDESEIEAVSAAMKKYADETIFELQDIVYLTGQLAGVGVDNYEQLAEATANLTAAAGKGATEFGYMSVAMSQINTAGVLHMQDWRQVMNALGGTGAQAIRDELEAMGAFDAEMMDFNKAMEEGEISAEEFNQAIMNLGMGDAALDAAYSVDTFEGAMGVLRAACVDAIMDIIDAIGMENITKFIRRLAEVIPPVIERVGPFVEDLARVLYELLMSIDPEKAGTGITRTIELFRWVGEIAFHVADSIRGIPQALKDTWQAVCDNVSGIWTNVLQPIFSAVGEFFSYVWESVVGSLNAVKENLQGLWDAVSGFWETLSGVFSGIREFFANFDMETFKQTVTEALSYIRDYFSQKFDEVKQKVTGVFTAIKLAIQTKLAEAKQAVHDAIEKIKSYFDFDWHLPDLKLPHIEITGEWGLNPPRHPEFTLKWYAQGGVFDAPSIIGVGERGPEAVVPLAGSAMQPFADSIAEGIGRSGYATEGVVAWLDRNLGPTISEYAPTATPREFGRLVRSYV